MASIHPYQTKTGERRYGVRYRDSAGRQRSRAFSTHKDARAFKLDIERKHRSPRASSRLFDGGELRRWLHSRHQGSTLDPHDGGR